MRGWCQGFVASWEQLCWLEVAGVGLCGTEPSGLLHSQKASPSRETVRGGQRTLKTASGLQNAQACRGFVRTLGSLSPALDTRSRVRDGASQAAQTFAGVIGSPEETGSCVETWRPRQSPCF